jgi:hypothetical protein
MPEASATERSEVRERSDRRARPTGEPVAEDAVMPGGRRPPSEARERERSDRGREADRRALRQV